MSDTPKLLAFGHSHLGSVQRAFMRRKRRGETDIEARFARLNLPAFQPNFETKLFRRVVSPALEKRIHHMVKNEAPTAILAALMGNEAASISMLRHPEPYDFAWAPHQLDPEPGTRVIPFDVMKATVRNLADKNILLLWKVLDKAARENNVPLYLQLPPPPIADEDHIRRYPGSFRARIDQYGLSPALFRLKIWLLYCEVVREALANSTTIVLDAPLEGQDEGYLAASYWSEDPTHGNADYGDLVLNHFLPRAFGEAAQPVPA